jgi:hypothetical protein
MMNGDDVDDADDCKSKFPLISSAGFHRRYKAVSQSDGMCPCVMCCSELSASMMVHHFDLCCSISHGGYPPANGWTYKLVERGLDLGQRKLM